MEKDRRKKMDTQYKVISDWLCITSGDKARKIEKHLNNLSAEGWEFVALDSVTVLGFDIGYYLVLKRTSPKSTSTQSK
jgi:hypothetical protein